MADTVNPGRAARDRFQFTGEGELVRLVNEFDWENTPLGAIGTWPDSVRGAVGIALESTLQMAILAGPELTCIYNDACAAVLGSAHPQALGQSLWTACSESAERLRTLLSPLLETGRAVRHDDMPVLLERHGHPEECYFTLSCSALRTGERIDGVFVSALETSGHVIGERRLRTLGNLAACAASLRGDDPHAALASALGANRDDIPCAALYLADAGAAEARLVLQTATSEHALRLCDAVRRDTEASAQSPVARAFATGLAQEFDAAGMLAPGKSAHALAAAPRRAIAFPLVVAGERRPRAVLVVAANPRQALDSAQRRFLDCVAGHVTTAIAKLEAERIEHERLAAIDALERQKSRLAADAGHEPRTPVGPGEAQDAGLHRVLVIGDSEDIVRHLAQALAPMARIEAAADAVAGLDAIRRLMPDIVLLDALAPGMGRFELLRIIRADAAIQAIPVLVLSAHAGEEARLEALAAGADDCLAKPFSAREVAAIVRSHASLFRIRRGAVEREARLLTEIAEARNDLESIIERTSDAFLGVDHDMRVVALNDVTARILERDRAALLGVPLLEMEPDAVPVHDALRSAMAGNRTVGLQYLHRPSGRWFAVRCYPSRHGAITLANEITRQKRAEARLQLAHAELELRVERRTRDLNSANALLEAVFDRAPVATAMSDLEGRIVRANAAYASLVGAGPAQMRGLGVDYYVHPDDLAQKRARLRQLVAGKGAGSVLEMRYRRAGGREIWVENFAALMHDEEGRPQFVVEIVQDITDRKRAADEVLASRNELRWLYDWLQRVRREERIALAREVHDQLGQILSAAKIDIKLLLEDVLASRTGLPRHKLLSELRSAATTLDQAIESARSIATGLRPPEIENQGLYTAIAWHSDDFERRTRVNLHVALPAPKGGPKGAAAVTLFRIFKEAMTNIVRHARATTVWVSVHRRGAFLFLRVRDNGVGIAPGRARAAGTLGLVGMRERAQLARGRVAIRALASGGTVVSAMVPAPEPGAE